MDLFDFWFSLLTEYKTQNDVSLIGRVGCFVNRVTSPDYTVVGLLSKTYRKQGIEKGKQLLCKINEYIVNNPHDPVNSGFIESIKLTMHWLEHDDEVLDETTIAKNRHLILESDQYRNRSLKKYIPELWEELQVIWSKVEHPYLPIRIIEDQSYTPDNALNNKSHTTENEQDSTSDNDSQYDPQTHDTADMKAFDYERAAIAVKSEWRRRQINQILANNDNQTSEPDANITNDTTFDYERAAIAVKSEWRRRQINQILNKKNTTK
jgi:hypothetical protein